MTYSIYTYKLCNYIIEAERKSERARAICDWRIVTVSSWKRNCFRQYLMHCNRHQRCRCLPPKRYYYISVGFQKYQRLHKGMTYFYISTYVPYHRDMDSCCYINKRVKFLSVGLPFWQSNVFTIQLDLHQYVFVRMCVKCSEIDHHDTKPVFLSQFCVFLFFSTKEHLVLVNWLDIFCPCENRNVAHCCILLLRAHRQKLLDSRRPISSAQLQEHLFFFNKDKKITYVRYYFLMDRIHLQVHQSALCCDEKIKIRAFCTRLCTVPL